MREITKAIAVLYPRILSGLNGNGFWRSGYTRRNFGEEYFTSFSPVSVLDTRGLLAGQRGNSARGYWRQAVGQVLGAFRVSTKVEDLSIVCCKTEAFFTTLGSTTDGGALLPELQRLTIYVGFEGLDIRALVQCAKARKGHSRPLEEVTVVLEHERGFSFVRELESLREFVGELAYRVGETPCLTCDMKPPGHGVGLRWCL